MPSSWGRLELREVGFRYTSVGARQLHGISFSVEPGQTVAIMGETGSGKTTLIQLLSRFYDPCDGAVLIGGVDLRSLPRSELHKHVAVVPQQSVLFSGTLRENLLLGRPSATEAELWEVLEMSDMSTHVRGLAEGLDHVVEQGGSNLSGGQKQRLCIARALLRKPDILVLDDSFSALDLSTEAHIRQSLTALRCTVVVVAQRISTIARADLIVVLDRGGLEAQGTHEELLQRSTTYRETYEAQGC